MNKGEIIQSNLRLEYWPMNKREIIQSNLRFWDTGL
jgi:hypothetical protein